MDFGSSPDQQEIKPAPAKAFSLEALVNDGASKAASHEDVRDYLGASILGKGCLRYLVYVLRQAPVGEVQGRIARIRQMGNIFEDLTAQWLKNIGVQLKTITPEGAQFGFTMLDGAFKGHIDGFIEPLARPLNFQVLDSRGAEIDFSKRMLWENKALKAASWRAIAKHGLKEKDYQYYAQAQTYMAYLELDSCLFTTINKDTAEIYFELVKFDRAAAQALTDQAVAAFEWPADSLPQRISKDPSFFKCKLCDRHAACWGSEIDV